MNYYSVDDVKEIMNTFTSWVGKNASLGDGTTEVLKAIEIKERRVAKAAFDDKKFSIHFKFANKLRFDADDFLLFNGLDQIKKNLPSNRPMWRNSA